jgi:hypothetical protein
MIPRSDIVKENCDNISVFLPHGEGWMHETPSATYALSDDITVLKGIVPYRLLHLIETQKLYRRSSIQRYMDFLPQAVRNLRDKIQRGVI